jgi:hypothetical protein
MADVQVQVQNTIPNIDDVRVTQFADRLYAKITQKGGKLTPFVEMQDFRGKDKTFDDFGGIELGELHGAFVHTTEGQIAHNRRFLDWKMYGKSIYVDEAKIREIIEDPQGHYIKRLAEAYGRLTDRLIINAVLADIRTGETGGTTVTAAADGVISVDATAGLTYEKILEITQNFIDNSVYDNAFENAPLLTITGVENTALLSELEFTSQDYRQFFEVNGMRMQNVGGINLIPYGANAINQTKIIVPTYNSGVNRHCVTFMPGAIILGIGFKVKLETVMAPERFNTAIIKLSVGIGALRKEGELCQIVNTTV